MGENLALTGRMSVRTPMQWTTDANGGFSTARPSTPAAARRRGAVRPAGRQRGRPASRPRLAAELDGAADPPAARDARARSGARGGVRTPMSTPSSPTDATGTGRRLVARPQPRRRSRALLAWSWARSRRTRTSMTSWTNALVLDEIEGHVARAEARRLRIPLVPHRDAGPADAPCSHVSLEAASRLAPRARSSSPATFSTSRRSAGVPASRGGAKAVTARD